MSKHFASRPSAIPSSDPLQGGLRLLETGSYVEAVHAFERVLQKQPRHPSALWYLGRTLLKMGQAEKSLPCLRLAVELRPTAHDPLFDFGVALLATGRFEDAVRHLSQLVALKPGWIEARAELGYAQHKLNRHDDAEATLRQALSLDPRHAETYNRLGTVLAAQNRNEEAIECFFKSIELAPRFAHTWSNLGRALKAMNKLTEALQAYSHALAIEPKSATARFNQSIVQLLQGDLRKEVWLKYEYRWVVLNESPRRGFTQPLWQGTESIAGKSILVYAEQGLGDTLQFVRYVPLLAAMGAAVHVEVQPALKALLAPLAGAASVIGRGEPLPHFDLHCPLMTLPFALDTRLETIPATTPYVSAPAERVATWQQKLGPATAGKRVGLVWRGNPNHANDANRSMPFELFQQVCQAGDCQFFPLQFQMNERETAFFANQPACANHTGQIRDFGDTAAFIAQLDIVLTVDTSVAHLAGAMGKPVWLLLPFTPDWRWLLDRADTPWYPGMRLFRQPAIGDWARVIEAVIHELSQPAAALAA